MQPDAGRHDRGEKRRQDCRAGDVVVLVFRIVRRIGAELARRVADIMQQRRCDEFVRCVLRFGQASTLQHMFRHGDGFAT